MQPKIYCKTTDKGDHNFYLQVNKQEYYLFSQIYRKSVQSYFNNGILLADIYDFSKAHRNNAITHTLTKLPLYIKYIESEYGITVLNRTRKKNHRQQKYTKLSA